MQSCKMEPEVRDWAAEARNWMLMGAGKRKVSPGNRKVNPGSRNVSPESRKVSPGGLYPVPVRLVSGALCAKSPDPRGEPALNYINRYI